MFRSGRLEIRAVRRSPGALACPMAGRAARMAGGLDGQGAMGVGKPRLGCYAGTWPPTPHSGSAPAPAAGRGMDAVNLRYLPD